MHQLEARFLGERSAMFVINPEDVEKEALAQGISRIELEVPLLVFLTFNQCILEEFSSTTTAPMVGDRYE